jgi:selenide,water dikinase
LLGHAREMVVGSAVSMKINHQQIAYLPGAVEAARGHFFSGGLKNNRDFCEGCVSFLDHVPEEFRALLFDPQTSGGLLVSIAPDSADAAMKALKRFNVPAQVIGEVIPRRSPLIEIA